MKTHRTHHAPRGDHRGTGLRRRTRRSRALPEDPAAHLRQPAAHGRHLHLRRAARAAAGAVAGEGVQPRGHHVVSGDRHDRSWRPTRSRSSARPTAACRAAAFADWRLSVEGSVARPRTFSLADLKQLPSRTQITRHTCEEGWTAIGQWTGVPLAPVLDAAGILPTARFVVFYSYDDWVDSIDMLDALHPQTILAYGMNGRDLPIPHGAPVRLRVERQIGYKSMKYLRAHRRDGRVRRRRQEGQHPERVGLVHGDLSSKDARATSCSGRGRTRGLRVPFGREPSPRGCGPAAWPDRGRDRPRPRGSVGEPPGPDRRRRRPRSPSPRGPPSSPGGGGPAPGPAARRFSAAARAASLATPGRTTANSSPP